MSGIALAGWDRTGWGTRWRIAEVWMRMRDRRAPLAVLALAAAYLALVGWALSLGAHALLGDAAPSSGAAMTALLAVNAVLLCWRLAVRAAATAAEHGWREGLWSIPRAPVANAIAMLAARRAIVRYVATLRGATPRWDKTAHRFPRVLPGRG
jgi:adsorption protein B